MALSDPTQTRTTDMQTSTTDYVAGDEPWNKNLDGFDIPDADTDVNHYRSDWSKWHGMYRDVSEARSTLDVWSKWIVSGKITMDDNTRKITDRIRGNGIDTFRKILINLKRTSKICGDAYAEKVKDKANRLINLKILDSGTIEVNADKFGIISEYKQVEVKNNQQAIINTWTPDEIFHVANDRIGDEIHGIPELEKLQKIIKWRQQSMSDMSVVFHRYVKPLLVLKAKTDDETEIKHLTTQLNNSIKNMENIVVPDNVISELERVSIPQYSTLDPLPWMIYLRSYFTEASNVPDIIRGKSDEVSLAAGKLNVYSYIEKIRMEQLDYAEEIKAQLGLDITFEKPKEIDVTAGNAFGSDKQMNNNGNSPDNKGNNSGETGKKEM